MPEYALIGWKEIGAYFRLSAQAMARHRNDLWEAGIIFYMDRGSPPRRRVMAFPSSLQRWAAITGHKQWLEAQKNGREKDVER